MLKKHNGMQRFQFLNNVICKCVMVYTTLYKGSCKHHIKPLKKVFSLIINKYICKLKTNKK